MSNQPLCIVCGTTEDVEYVEGFGVNLCDHDDCHDRAWLHFGDRYLVRRRRYYVDIRRASAINSSGRNEARIWAGDLNTAHQWATIVNGHPSYRAGIGFVRAA